MSLTEILPALHELPRVDKLRVIQFLVIELAKDEGVNLLEPNKAYPVWSPYNAFEAASVLLNALAMDQRASHG
ncbi:MAG: hypothetical protein HY260_21760 [Chloroflexi bacterium]|nr:hypothetical protein [Chloroflexota bacterium]